MSHQATDLRQVAIILRQLELGHLGGAEVQSLRLARGLARRGICVTVMSEGAAQVVPAYCGDEVAGGTVRVADIPAPRRRLVGTAVYLVGLTRAIVGLPRSAVVHVNYITSAALAAALVAKLLGHRVVCRSTGEDLHTLIMRHERGAMGARLHIALLKLVDRIVAQNGHAARSLSAMGIAPGRICIIPNGVDTESFRPCARMRRMTHIGDSGRAQSCSILCLSNLRSEKRVDLALSAVQLVRVAGINAHLTVLGKGPLLAQLRQQAEALGVADVTRWEGFRDAPLPFLQEADLFVMPSDRENHSNALLEAMACGLPVVATDVGGNRETITHGVDGLLVQVGSPEALAQAILELLRDPVFADCLGRAARRTVEERFSLDGMVDAYLQCYSLDENKLPGRCE